MLIVSLWISLIIPTSDVQAGLEALSRARGQGSMRALAGLEILKALSSGPEPWLEVGKKWRGTVI
jgi:hypothetical protein